MTLQATAAPTAPLPPPVTGLPAPVVGATAADVAVAAALSQLGKPYVWGASGPDTYDCSGLMQWAYGKASVSCPKPTYNQVLLGQAVSTTDRSQWMVGDLIFPDAGHVQMYTGNGMIVEAPHAGAFVQHVPEWASTIFAVRRITAPGTGSYASSGSPNGSVAATNVGLFSTAGRFLGDLVNLKWWERLGMTLGGFIMVIFALDLIMADGKAAQAATDAIKGALA